MERCSTPPPLFLGGWRSCTRRARVRKTPSADYSPHGEININKFDCVRVEPRSIRHNRALQSASRTLTFSPPATEALAAPGGGRPSRPGRVSSGTAAKCRYPFLDHRELDHPPVRSPRASAKRRDKIQAYVPGFESTPGSVVATAVSWCFAGHRRAILYRFPPQRCPVGPAPSLLRTQPSLHHVVEPFEARSTASHGHTHGKMKTSPPASATGVGCPPKSLFVTKTFK